MRGTAEHLIPCLLIDGLRNTLDRGVYQIRSVETALRQKAAEKERRLKAGRARAEHAKERAKTAQEENDVRQEERKTTATPGPAKERGDHDGGNRDL